jgi:hypothetical protein
MAASEKDHSTDFHLRSKKKSEAAATTVWWRNSNGSVVNMSGVSTWLA